MRFLSVCSGIDAASVAWAPLGWQPWAFSEIEAFPSALLAHRFPGVPNLGDMTRFQGWPDADVDVLVGGTPCQDYSIAGQRLGMAGSRGQLTLTFVEIAARYRPRWVVWENVPGVLSSNAGRDFARFLGDISGQTVGVPAGGWKNAGIVAGIGDAYGLAYRVLDAQYCRVDGFPRAVPQRRRRVFVVGYPGDWRPAAAVLLEPEGLRGDPPPRREAGAGAAGTLTRSLGGGRNGGPRGADDNSAQACHLIAAEVAATLPAGGNATGGDRQPGTAAETAATMLVAHAYGGGNTSGAIDAAATLTAKGMRIDFEVETFVLPQPIAFNGRQDPDVTGERAGALNGMSPQDQCVAFTVSQQANGFAWERPVHPTLQAHRQSETSARQVGVRVGSAVRRLTPTECERLQGFPDGWTAIPYRGKPAADGPRYKALGNSMAVNVMRWLGRRVELVEREIARPGGREVAA